MKLIIATIITSIFIVISTAAYADVASETIALVKNSKADCLNCHQIDKKIVGPSWKDVAAKYKGDANAQEALVTKVIKGGSGHWNDQTGGLPMTPHPVKPSKEEIDQIIASLLKL
jgi:cytochrome c